MKRLFAVFLLCFAFTLPVNAVTTYYQPTWYPLKKMDGTAMPQDINIVHIHDGWFNSNYAPIMTFQRDDKLQIGGFGDIYTSPLSFDLTGLPATVDNVHLYLWALPSGAANPSQVSLWPIISDWTPATIGWNNFPQTTSGYYWPVSTVVNAWRSYWITGWYNDWKNGVRPDKGILIWPYNSDGTTQRFDKFASSRVSAPTDARYFGYRPILRLDFTPTLTLKMPLPGGYRWLLTNEVGGYECMGETPWPDTTHQGNNYFSLDFSPTNIKEGGGSYSGSIPILASAGGTVLDVGGGQSDSRGYYVTLSHGNGYQTRYIHLQQAAARKNGILLANGNSVNQGDQIGIMGGSGTPATPVHLHMNFWLNGVGASTTTNITKVVMNGWLLKSFQTECAVNSNGVPTSRIRYYHSTNIPTGS